MITEEHLSFQISKNDLIVLNPWLSGRGAFPGRIEIITSKPITWISVKYNLIRRRRNKFGIPILTLGVELSTVY